jgi:hypothetical protein
VGELEKGGCWFERGVVVVGYGGDDRVLIVAS